MKPVYNIHGIREGKAHYITVGADPRCAHAVRKRMHELARALYRDAWSHQWAPRFTIEFEHRGMDT